VHGFLARITGVHSDSIGRVADSPLHGGVGLGRWYDFAFVQIMLLSLYMILKCKKHRLSAMLCKYPYTINGKNIDLLPTNVGTTFVLYYIAVGEGF